MLRRQYRQHGCEGLAFAIGQLQCYFDGSGNFFCETLQDALTRCLAKRDSFDGRLHHIFRPAEGKGQCNVTCARLSACGCERESYWIGGDLIPEPMRGIKLRRLHFEPFNQRASHLFGLQAQLMRFSRLQDPSVELLHALRIIAPNGSHCLTQRCQIAACQADVQLILQPSCYRIRSYLRRFYGGFQRF